MKDVALNLSADQALVLFDLLAGVGDGSRAAPDLNDAERIVLSYVEASLEAVLAEPFDADYRELVRQARARLETPVD